MKVAVLGAGAIGAHVGAALHRAGADVHLIARGPHLAAMRQHGVRVRSPRGDFTAHAHATDDPAEVGPAYAAIRTRGSTGPKLFCVSGSVARPGVYEVPFGATLGDVLALAGVRGGLRAVLLGGAAGGFVRADELDIPLTFEGTREAGTTLGSGVVMAFDDSVPLPRLLLRIADFFRDESCGQCVPCRVGTVRQEEALHRIAERTGADAAGDIALLREVGRAMRDASICGLGQTAWNAVESAIDRLGAYE